MSPREEWRGHYDRMRAEAARFAELATANRKSATDKRRRRDWLGALMADSRAAEFRKWRDERKDEAAKIRRQWKF